ncbi:MAG: hypothetical protein V4760_08475 [Bdellovibrionota bacterium]
MRLAALAFICFIGFAQISHADGSKAGFSSTLYLGGISQVGELASQGLRFGAGFGATYKFDSDYAIDVAYQGASFNDIDHRDFDFGAKYFPEIEYFDQETNGHLSFGFSFIHNDFKTVSRSGDAVGIYVGAGMDFGLTERLRLGYELRFHKVAPSKATVAGTEITTVSDTASLMLALTYAPDFSD